MEWYVSLWPWMHVAGRVLFSLIFIASGMSHFLKMKDTVGYATFKHAPAPKVLVPITGAMIAVGGLLVVLGWHRFIGAGLIFLFLVPTAFFMHAFWKETDPMAKAVEQAQFMKNVSLAGAALLIACYSGPEWPMSLGH